MSEAAQEFLLSGFLVFCRVGMCLMLMPALSSPRIPMLSRLMFAIALSLAVAPIVFDDLRDVVHGRGEFDRFGLVGSELVVGGVIGGLARVFFSAIESAGQAISSLAGLTGIFSQEVTSDETGTPLSSILSMAAGVLVLASDIHLQIFRGIINSYLSLPPGMELANVVDLQRFVETLGASFYVTLQICGPFILFAVLFNLALGLLNRLVPQIPVYFVSSPFVAAGGLVMMHVLAKPILALFIAAFAGWMVWK